MIEIRFERKSDMLQVRAINEQAFEQPYEAEIVDQLRQNCSDALSLVADDGNHVVGHILFTPVVIEDQAENMPGMGLAPMAVLPQRQRQGIGSQLVRKGLNILQDRGCPFVVVLGHPDFYPKFGFEPACQYNITCQWHGVADQAFMILVFDKSAIQDVKGIARYRSEFDAAL